MHTDTLFIAGMIISPDTHQPSEISRYCTVELIDEKGKIVTLQKLACPHSTFHTRIPLDSLRPSRYFIVRAYTRFMQNFAHYPMEVIGMELSQQFPFILRKTVEERESLQLALTSRGIVYRFLAMDSIRQNTRLTLYSSGQQVWEKILHNEDIEGIWMPDSLPSHAIYGLVTERDSFIRASRFLSLDRSRKKEPVLLYDSIADAGNPFTIRLQGGEEDVTMMIRLEKAEEPKSSLLLHELSDFRQDKAKVFPLILGGQFPYHVVPEQVLSLQGIVRTESKRDYKREGLLVAFNNETGHTYDADIASDGTFTVGVDDFKEGNSFFLQAYDRKGKSNFYQIEMDEEYSPDLYFPKIAWRDSRMQVLAEATDSSEIEWETNKVLRLPGVVINAYLHKENTPSTHHYKTTFKDRKEIEEKSLTTMESILRKMPGIVLRKTEEGLYNAFSARDFRDTAAPIKFNVDGSWVENANIEDVVGTFNIETIEYIPGSRAFSIFGPKAFSGVIAIKTRSGKTKTTAVPSKGITIQPIGLSDNSSFSERVMLKTLFLPAGKVEELRWIVPQLRGKYRLVVEMIGKKHTASYRSYPLLVL